jgi:hypothetical protein
MNVIFAASLLTLSLSLNICLASDLKKEIQSLLEDRHPSESREEWKKLGPGASSVILKMLESTRRVDHRARLISGLAAFQSPAVVRFLKKEALSSSTDSILRSEALHSLGASQNVKELKFIAGYLKNEDPQIRLAAAETLKEMNHFQADTLLGDYVSHEKTAWIVSRLNGEFPDPVQNSRHSQKKKGQVAQAAISGKWTGFLVSSFNGEELKSESALLTISGEQMKEMTGGVSIQKKGGVKRLKLNELRKTSEGFSGLISEDTSNSAPIPFQAEVYSLEGHVFMNLKFSSQAGILVLQKNMIP